MALDVRVAFRISVEEHQALEGAAKALGVNSAIAMRQFMRDSLKAYDAPHRDLVSRLDAMQLQLEDCIHDIGLASKSSQESYLMAASAVGLLSSLDIPPIAGQSREETANRIMDNVDFALIMGKRILNAHGKSGIKA